jgi:putative PIN family toxin of toxin-antitoxin system
MTRRYQVVLDSNVLVSALRSKRGASFALLAMVGTGRFDINLSVPLVLEYEQVLRRARWQNRPSWSSVSDILDYLCRVGRRHKIHFLWRPRERDPKDDMVLEVAVAGECDCIVTYNRRDFGEARSFGLDLLTPKELLAKMGDWK